MAITNGSILREPTVTLSAGTATTLSEISDSNGTKRVFLDTGASFLDRIEVGFKVITPKPNLASPNGYTQLRTEVVMVSPYTPATGTRTTNSLRCSVSVDPALSAADKRLLMRTFVSLLMDADLDSFYINGSLA